MGKELGKGSGAEFMKVAPAKFCVPYTNLQLNAYGTALCSTHLMNAALTEDPLERLKWVCGYYVGG